MNKLQLALVLGFAMGIVVAFGHFRTVFIPMSQETQSRKLNKTPSFVWPDTVKYDGLEEDTLGI